MDAMSHDMKKQIHPNAGSNSISIVAVWDITAMSLIRIMEVVSISTTTSPF